MFLVLLFTNRERQEKQNVNIQLTRRAFVRNAAFGMAAAAATSPASHSGEAAKRKRPNILFAMADDWGWPHAGAYGDPVVKTPTFDRLAREGVLFSNAFVASPSCTPSRGAIFTGQHIWRLGAGANLYGSLPEDLPLYTTRLEEDGYFVGFERKGWGPGTMKKNPAGARFNSFKEFLDARPADNPFCFWFGSTDPHRDYKEGSGKAGGMDLDAIRLFECFPDHPIVRSDVADYYWEVQRFDREVGELLAELGRRGELDNTLIVMTGDNGIPFPRCKANLYDGGSHVGLALRLPGTIRAGRVVDDFVGLPDLAPTFLEMAGLEPPREMTYRSLAPILASEKSGRIDPTRDHVLIGKERHCPCQEAPDSGGTPMRAIRTHDFLYIRNFRPDRWPAGTPNFEKAFLPGSWYGDCDNGPTKSYMIDNRDKDERHRRLFELAFGKRPAEELYDLRKDPGQLDNAAGGPDYAKVRQELADRLTAALKSTGDPRVVGDGEAFDRYPYTGGTPRHPSWSKQPGKGP